MYLFILSVHFILCLALIGIVLVQQGKGADMGAAFGAGGSNSLFGAGGANSLVVKVTTFLAIAFMVTSVALIRLSGSDTALSTLTATAEPEITLQPTNVEPAKTENTENKVNAENPVNATSATSSLATEKQAGAGEQAPAKN